MVVLMVPCVQVFTMVTWGDAFSLIPGIVAKATSLQLAVRLERSQYGFSPSTRLKGWNVRGCWSKYYKRSYSSPFINGKGILMKTCGLCTKLSLLWNTLFISRKQRLSNDT